MALIVGSVDRPGEDPGAATATCRRWALLQALDLTPLAPILAIRSVPGWGGAEAVGDVLLAAASRITMSLCLLERYDG